MFFQWKIQNIQRLDFFLSLHNTLIMDKTEIIHQKADLIRNVIRYIQQFKNATVVVYIDNSLIDSPVFINHIKDLCFIHDAGLKLILVPGASRRIDEVLKSSNIPWKFYDNCRITEPDAMPLIKMAAFDVSNQIMTAFAGQKKTAVIGNWVRARGKGVINGFDYGTTGEIDKLEIDSIRTVLDNGFIPIFPCIGWNLSGKPYNISSMQLAEQISSHLKADKLFFLVPGADISPDQFNIPENIGISDNCIPAMNLSEVDDFIKANLSPTDSAQTYNQSEEFLHTNNRLEANNDSQSEDFGVSREKVFMMLNLAKKACLSGVKRVHIINGLIDGSVPCEIFSNLGSGTMIYVNSYGNIRNMGIEDIPAVLSIMKPFVDSGILLPRTKKMFHEQYKNYIVYEIDGSVKATAGLIPYPDGQMEIAGVAVDPSCSHMGIGPKLIEYLIERAKKENAKRVFVLTTQTSDWFEHLGFTPCSKDLLPIERQKKWTPERGSKVLFLDISNL